MGVRLTLEGGKVEMGETSMEAVADDSAAEPRKLVSFAHRQLREAILTNAIPADSTISQVQLAKHLGVSRTPLREALRLLEHEGLATVEVNKKVTGANVSPEDLDALYALRIQQESLAIFKSVQKADQDRLDRSREHLEGMQSAIGDHDYVRWAKHHRIFHMSLVDGVSDRFCKSIRQNFDHAERYRRIYVSESDTNWNQSQVDHQSIFNALVEGNPAAAAELLASHYSHTAKGVLAAIDAGYTPELMNAAVTMAISLRFQQ
jgi:DNA-binding GntR family transcriptional regulator